jgi:sortase B
MNRKKLKRIIQIFAIIFFLGCIGFLLYYLVIQPYHSKQVNDKYRDIYYSSSDEETSSPKETETKYVAAIDIRYKNNAKDENGILCKFKKLLSYNEDVKGWLKIDGTGIDYPVMQDFYGGEFYLKHDFEGNKDKNGCLYIDGRCNVKKPSKNIIIHGHNMESTHMMFYELPKYKDIDFYRKHPVITFDSIYKNSKWKIIAFMRVSGTISQNSGFNYLTSDFESDEDFLDFLYQIENRSLYYCPVDVNENDRLIMLSTCSYEINNYRTVVVARRVRKGESTKVDTSQAYIRNDVLFPDSYYSQYGGYKPLVTDFRDAMSFNEINWYDGNITVESSIGNIINADGLSYRITSTDTVMFTGCSSKLTELYIPSTVSYNKRNFKVTEIDSNAFKNMKNLQKLVIGNNITEIKSHEFDSCASLTKISIGEGVAVIGKKAFYKLENLKYVKIKSEVLREIDEKAFFKIHEKVRFTLPKNKYSSYKNMLVKSGVPEKAKYIKWND